MRNWDTLAIYKRMTGFLPMHLVPLIMVAPEVIKNRNEIFNVNPISIVLK
jgi:hypothetical protein